MSDTGPRKLSDLAPAPYNPRKITDLALSGLKRSLSEFGDISGVTWNKRTGHLVTGHQRVKALTEQHGDLEIRDGQIVTPDGDPIKVRVVDWPESKEHAANVASNSPTISGEFTCDLEDLLATIEIEDASIFHAMMFEDLFLPPDPLVYGDGDLSHIPSRIAREDGEREVICVGSYVGAAEATRIRSLAEWFREEHPDTNEGAAWIVARLEGIRESILGRE